MPTNNVVLPTENPIRFNKSWDQFRGDEETLPGKGDCPKDAIPNWCGPGTYYCVN